MLGPILRQPDRTAAELLETLDSLYCKGRIADVAEALYFHEKTIRYRLRNVQGLTGLRLDVPADRLRLDLALLVRRVAAAEAAE